MGGRGAFQSEGGFSAPFEYESIGKIMGVKVLRYKFSSSKKLPEFSNTSEAYLSLDRFGKPNNFEFMKNDVRNSTLILTTLTTII